jgi:hypothetical protein
MLNHARWVQMACRNPFQSNCPCCIRSRTGGGILGTSLPAKGPKSTAAASPIPYNIEAAAASEIRRGCKKAAALGEGVSTAFHRLNARWNHLAKPRATASSSAWRFSSIRTLEHHHLGEPWCFRAISCVEL